MGGGRKFVSGILKRAVRQNCHAIRATGDTSNFLPLIS
jgi:hypothetical protein